MEQSGQAIEALLDEQRLFDPPAAFRAAARVRDEPIYAEADADPAGWWKARALEELEWIEAPTQGLDDSNPPFFKWFADGILNVSVNCLDRHLAAGGGDKTAYVWVGEPADDERTISYQQLHDDVNRFANVLKGLGVQRGDRVAIYLGMVPELPVAMLACARIGAAHSVVFGGFSSTSLAGRIDDAECKVLITADGGWRKGAIVPLKDNADAALAQSEGGSVEHVVVVRRTGHDVAWAEGRDHWWHELMAERRRLVRARAASAPRRCCTSCTRPARPRARRASCTRAPATCSVPKLTHKLVFDIREDDVYWCAADIGWVTGHSYIVYGPLANHTTGVMYEGAPEHPAWDRHWEIIERHGVTIYYTAPTAIRAFVKAGVRAPRGSRPLEPAPARHGRRADQPRGLDLVPRAGRRRPLPDRRHLVADRDGRDHDLAAARASRARSPGSACRPLPGHPRRGRRREGQRGAARRGRLSHAHAPLAGDAADVLQRRRALREDLLGALRPAGVLHRRRREARHRRLLLAARARRRRDQRLGPSHLDDRDRERARRASRRSPRQP